MQYHANMSVLVVNFKFFPEDPDYKAPSRVFGALNRIAGFDLMNTLIERRSMNCPDRNPHNWRWLHSKTIAKLRSLYDNEQYKLVVFYNEPRI